MDCLHCELTRARAKAQLWAILRMSRQQIADRLAETYGERYYVEDGVVLRASKLPPYQPHRIYPLQEKQS
ncbi:hypothetical protein [Bordetella phage FP1]|uniref:Uncharacterized protein n=1 Tax=Bordetella phage FP1 TaxID=1916125 RepID=A0A2D0W9N3_9CAUD|nr:hypothetical protein HOS31_gp51 [Bordetella phage FP1]APL99350.1 hypothetical protein [Bordetella phage FP1]